MQPASSTQLLAHVLVLAQAYGEQLLVVDGLQVPSPLQAKPVCTPDEQLVAPQLVPGTYSSQDAEPLHEPSRLHVPAPSSGHSLSGSLPARTLPHVPSLPDPFLVAVQA